MSPRIVLAVFTVAVTQAACGMFGSSTSASGMGPAQCVAANAKDYLGQELDLRTVDEARAHAGAMRSRVIRPGERVSGDRDPLRLDVELGPDNRIHRLRCG